MDRTRKDGHYLLAGLAGAVRSRGSAGRNIRAVLRPVYTCAEVACIRASPFALVYLREGRVLVGISAVRVLWSELTFNRN